MRKHTPKGKLNQRTLAEAPQNYVYEADGFQLEVVVNNEEVWLSQKDMALLFGVATNTINEHIKSVVADDGKSRDDNSTIRKFRIVADDGKSREILHYGLDIIIPVGYRVGSPQATEFRKWANGVIKQYLLVGYAINEKKLGNKSMLKMEKDLSLLERHDLMNRPEAQRLSLLYENKKGAELLWAIVDDVCFNPDFARIKGMEYKVLFGMIAEDLKALLGSKDIRAALPDRQLKAFTLAETTLREILAAQKDISNERVLDAVRVAFEPIGVYLRSTSQFMGVHHVTNQPLLATTNR